MPQPLIVSRNEPTKRAPRYVSSGPKDLRTNDLADLEDVLKSVIDRSWVGEFDGDEIVKEKATVFMYGANGNAFFLSD